MILRGQTLVLILVLSLMVDQLRKLPAISSRQPSFLNIIEELKMYILNPVTLLENACSVTYTYFFMLIIWDEVLISGFGHKGRAVGDIRGVRFEVVKFYSRRSRGLRYSWLASFEYIIHGIFKYYLIVIMLIRTMASLLFLFYYAESLSFVPLPVHLAFTSSNSFPLLI
uniref:Uncharacterized protein n=1 Tax=Oryza barthii TaxID=65489 RepID=A0A0D3G4N8_9ORYZ